MNEKILIFWKRNGRYILGSAFLMIFIVSFAYGLGYNVLGFWFLVIINFTILIQYFKKKDKADRRQSEINRYREFGVKKRGREYDR